MLVALKFLLPIVIPAGISILYGEATIAQNEMDSIYAEYNDINDEIDEAQSLNDEFQFIVNAEIRNQYSSTKEIKNHFSRELKSCQNLIYKCNKVLDYNGSYNNKKACNLINEYNLDKFAEEQRLRNITIQKIDTEISEIKTFKESFKSKKLKRNSNQEFKEDFLVALDSRLKKLDVARNESVQVWNLLIKKKKVSYIYAIKMSNILDECGIKLYECKDNVRDLIKNDKINCNTTLASN